MINDPPSLSIAITRLNAIEDGHNFALWVLHAPYVGGYLHDDHPWDHALTHKWLKWQEMFTCQSEPHLPVHPQHNSDLRTPKINFLPPLHDEKMGYAGLLMQDLGVHLWKWLFSGTINSSLAQSQGIAIGKDQPLRLRLDIRDPNLIPLPWEIMQPEAGKQAVSLNQKILFSRTSSDVDPLSLSQAYNNFNILLVLGEKDHFFFSSNAPTLNLEIEAETLKLAMENGIKEANNLPNFDTVISPQIDILIQPNPAQLIQALDSRKYNIFFYAGHGKQAPNGGLLFLNSEEQINGTELAQVLVRNKVTLALFNACWGAQPDQNNQTTIPRSSLAEVLIHHGVPAVLGMRDLIADEEALSFIQAFSQALAQKMPIDQAVAVARQQLLTIYKFNQPAWTLPILYMHPEFNGQLIKTFEKITTELPTILPKLHQNNLPNAYICYADQPQIMWRFKGNLMRIGRGMENDVVMGEKWVSSKHGEIICREHPAFDNKYLYYYKDFSRFGTFIYDLEQNVQKIHHQEIILQSGFKLQLGSDTGQVLKFMIEPKN